MIASVTKGCGQTTLARGRLGAAARVTILGLSFVALVAVTSCAHHTRVAPREANVPFAFPQVEEVDDSDYLGGYREVVIAAPPDAVMLALLNIESFRKILPMLRSFTPLPTTPEGHLMADIDEGGSLGHAKYTARVERRGDTVRFWIDRTRPHEIEDAFGWFKIAAEGEGTRVRFRVWIDVGSGLTETMFGGQIQSVALQIPERLRKFVEKPGTKDTPASSASGSASPPPQPPSR